MAIPCFVANWKMNKTVAETLSYLAVCKKRLSDTLLQNSVTMPAVEVILAPPHTALFSAGQWIKESGLQTSRVAGAVPPSLHFALAAQNLYFEAEGPYTGEVSSRMLCEAGCQYVIIGHSERRSLFGENDFTIALKVKSAIEAGLTPILCVGERAQEREEGKTLTVVTRQVKEGLCKMEGDRSHCIVAYEPIWAIGTGKTPNPFEVEQVHKEIAQIFGRKGIPRILYGGSVNEENVAAFMKEPHVDGMLIGGASLSAEKFFNIVQLGVGA